MNIPEWVKAKICSGFGDGSGYGVGYGYGDGSGYGVGDGSGDYGYYGEGYASCEGSGILYKQVIV